MLTQHKELRFVESASKSDASMQDPALPAKKKQRTQSPSSKDDETAITSPLPHDVSQQEQSSSSERRSTRLRTRTRASYAEYQENDNDDDAAVMSGSNSVGEDVNDPDYQAVKEENVDDEALAAL